MSEELLRFSAKQSTHKDSQAFVKGDRVVLLITKFQAATIRTMIESTDTVELRVTTASIFGYKENKVAGQMGQLKSLLRQIPMKKE